MANRYPRLIADVGGTNARFAIEQSPLVFSQMKVLPCVKYETLLAAINDYFSLTDSGNIDHIVIAIATAVNDDDIKMTNHHWHFSIKQMQRDLGVDTLYVINDFTAQALAVTAIGDEHLHHIGGQKDSDISPIAVVGAGTGLGVSGLIPDHRGQMIPLSGEGGHTAFAPRDTTQRELLAYAQSVYPDHVSVERLLQGQGLLLIDTFVRQQQKLSTENAPQKPADVTRLALSGEDTCCHQALSIYCAILGDFCANLVLTLGATGGVYIGGGIVPRFIEFLVKSDFRHSFENKGRFSDYMKPIPAYVVLHHQPGLLGAAVALDHYLQ